MNHPFSVPLTWMIAGFLVLAALSALRKPLGKLFRLTARCLGGLAALTLFHPVGQIIGISVGINPINALVLGVLGAPGFGLLLMLQWALQTP